jgi:hypothetical protein
MGALRVGTDLWFDPLLKYARPFDQRGERVRYHGETTCPKHVDTSVGEWTPTISYLSALMHQMHWSYYRPLGHLSARCGVL